MPEKKMEDLILEMSYLSEESQRELDSYRNIGSVSTFKRLRRQEAARIRRRKQIKWAVSSLFFGICFALDIWVFASWIDIILHNLDPDPVYQIWNIFTLLVN